MPITSNSINRKMGKEEETEPVAASGGRDAASEAEVDDEGDEPSPKWHKYFGPLAFILKWKLTKKKKKKKGRDWRQLREERVAAEMAAAAEDERLKQEKKDARRLDEEETKKKEEAEAAIDGDEVHRRRDDDEGAEENSAANIALNAVVRGYLARRLYKKKYACAISANITYFGDTKRAEVEKRMALSKRRAGMTAANTFFRQYVVDLIDSSAMYLVQCAAATTLQKNWRGAMCRYWLNYKPPPRPKKPPPTRFTPQTLRRVWARKEFTPKGGWPGRASEAVVYDFREYQDRPPKGSNFGIKTPKVHSNVANQEEMDILVDEQYAWVGLPVQVEPKVLYDRNLVRSKQDLMLLEGASPYVGPQFVAPVRPPPKAQKGVEAIKGLGWRKDMKDNRRAVKGDGKRAYHIIDPYSSAALAADLATVVSASDFSGGGGSSSVSGSSKPKAVLGSLLDEQSIGSLTTLESFGGASRFSPNKNTLGVGMGVWNGTVQDHNQVPAANALDDKHFSDSMTTAENAEILQLVTPTRGYVKPMSEHRKLALAQAGLLPEQLEETYELQQRRTLIDHQKTTIFEQHAKSKKLDSIRLREQLKRARLGKVKTHTDQKFMDNPDFWKKSASFRLLEGASKLAAEMRDAESEAFDDDPWTRSTYTPKKEFSSKVVVWKKKPAEYYKFKYSWLPQPMLKNGVLSIYPDKRKDEYKDDAMTGLSEEASIASVLSQQSGRRSNSPDKSRKNVKGRWGTKIAPKGGM